MIRKVLNILIGLWLMIAPAVLNYNTVAADNVHITGPIILSLSIIALWDCTRNIIKFNILIAIWIVIAPFILDYQSIYTQMNDIISGVLIIVFSSGKFRAEKKYNGGWQSLWKKRGGLNTENNHNYE